MVMLRQVYISEIINAKQHRIKLVLVVEMWQRHTLIDQTREVLGLLFIFKEIL